MKYMMRFLPDICCFLKYSRQFQSQPIPAQRCVRTHIAYLRWRSVSVFVIFGKRLRQHCNTRRFWQVHDLWSMTAAPPHDIKVIAKKGKGSVKMSCLRSKSFILAVYCFHFSGEFPFRQASTEAGDGQKAPVYAVKDGSGATDDCSKFNAGGLSVSSRVWGEVYGAQVCCHERYKWCIY